MAPLRIDLRGRRGARRAVEAAAGVSTRVDGALLVVEDTMTAPRAAARVRRCTLPCSAAVTGIADLQRSPEDNARSFERTLLRLRVEHPGGPAECCVRQHVPLAIAADLEPGTKLAVLTAVEDPMLAVADWATVAREAGIGLDWIKSARQYAWPDREEWPASEAIEVRDGRRHRRRLAQHREQWSPVVGRITAAHSRHTLTDRREVWTLVLALDGGHEVTVKERTPLLAIARLERLQSTQTPIAVLVSPDGGAVVDWEATLKDAPASA